MVEASQNYSILLKLELGGSDENIQLDLTPLDEYNQEFNCLQSL